MLILIYTNCQGFFIYDFYLKYTSFFQINNVKCIKNYQDVSNDDFELFKICDIIIYQQVSVENGFQNTESQEYGLLNLLKKDCIKICFPCLYLNIFPIYEENGKYIGGDTLNKYKNQNMTLDNIIPMYENGLYDFELEKRFEKSIEYLKNKEDQYCNIKVYDFIMENYKNKPLFYTQNHPTETLLTYICQKITELLNIDNNEINYNNKYYNNLIWPNSIYMKNELKMDFIDNDNKYHYGNLIIHCYNHPELIKYK